MRKIKKQEKHDKGITSITVSGFKSLADECTIDVKPLTILAGANSSGKSSIMQPLLLMKQTLEDSVDSGPLKIYGPHIKFTDSKQFFSRLPNKNELPKMTVGISIDNINKVQCIFENYNNEIKLVESKYDEQKHSYKLNDNTKMENLKKLLSDKISIATKNECSIDRYKCFYTVIFYSYNKQSKIIAKMNVFDYLIYEFFLLNLIHIPGLRGNPERSYNRTAVGSNFPGEFIAYTASIIEFWQSIDEEQIQQLWSALEILGLTWKVIAAHISESHVELKVGRLPHSRNGSKKDLVNIADVGFGVSQVLPVLVALYVAKPGQLVYIEQPELHLHPRAQVAMAEVLVEAAQRGVKVVVETHSALLLTGIQTIVAEGKYSPENVSLNWFERMETGCSKITSVHPDELGAYGDWPEDFGKIHLDSDSRYLDAVDHRMIKKYAKAQ